MILLYTLLFFCFAGVFATLCFPITSVFCVTLASIPVLKIMAKQLPNALAKPIYWVHAMSLELFSNLVLFAFFILPKMEKLKGHGRPILLVHGYLHHGGVWCIQKKRLERKGFGPIYIMHFGSAFESIETYANVLKEKAAAIAHETGRSDLILIGHSMGGLISTWYATQLAPKDSVTDIITLASPFFGTHMAKLAVGTDAREMEIDSPFLKNLQKSLEERKHFRMFHIATKSDQLVIPNDSAIIPTNPHFVLDDVGHASLLFSKRAADQICLWLGQNY